MRVVDTPIDLNEFFAAPAPSCGALASFVGLVRDHADGRSVLRLHYEAYAPMAERELARIIEEAASRWQVGEIRVKHRVGTLAIGEAAVAIAVTSAHRGEAFAACRYVIEQIKTRVPVWKKEIYEGGESGWVRCAHAHNEAA